MLNLSSIDIIQALTLLLCAYTAKEVYQIKKQLIKISRPNPAKIGGLCQVVEKNGFGEWDRLGKPVRVGSKDYLKAIETPGVAVMHRSGEVEEGIQ